MESKVILVTGASRGIGRGIAKELALDGNIVIANYNKSKEKAEELKAELASKNINIDIYKADVSKRLEVQAMIRFIIEKYGKIDVLVNNAGIDQVKLFTDVTDEDWNYVVNNNLYSAFCVTQETARYMLQAQKGNIINISSIYSHTGAACESIYAITKAGIDGLTKSLAREFSQSNIRVNSIAPGWIDTDMNAGLTKEEIEGLEEEIPLSRAGQPEDIAKTVIMLMECEYITGQVINVNGGWYM